MKSSIRRQIVGVLSCTLLLFIIGGCQLRRGADISAVPEDPCLFERIAIVPFQKILPVEGQGNFAYCPLCGAIVHAQRFSGDPEQTMEQIFMDRLGKAKPPFVFLNGERVAGVLKRVTANSLKAPLRQVLCEVGRELGADAVVTGYLYRYQERRGSAFAVERAASVTFEMHLLRVSDGAIVWRGYVDKTQVSLLEDLFQLKTFFRGKGQWMTAEELLAEGIDRVLESFPGLQRDIMAPGNGSDSALSR